MAKSYNRYGAHTTLASIARFLFDDGPKQARLLSRSPSHCISRTGAAALEVPSGLMQTRIIHDDKVGHANHSDH
ncbi:hypothetical protein [Pelomonas cellulosilytica]|uniref:Uncharacterized protein n=1 Tax=Pelomonas cellulosilytica TaxID=2906762 RepID=A0ABS8Y1H7_9BURK|nr:hypothetical protein [Pelomonas sp. P8]MCE4555630.1 hypothetical protein [Pelomonas sp. P8]